MSIFVPPIPLLLRSRRRIRSEMLRNACLRQCASRTLGFPSAFAADRTIILRSLNTTSTRSFSIRSQRAILPAVKSNATISVIKRWQSQFQQAKPPSPADLGKPASAKTYRRSRKWLRRLVRLAIAVAIIGTVDAYLYDRCLTRSVRTFYTGLDRKSTRLNSSHSGESRMPSSA